MSSSSSGGNERCLYDNLQSPEKIELLIFEIEANKITVGMLSFAFVQYSSDAKKFGRALVVPSADSEFPKMPLHTMFRYSNPNVIRSGLSYFDH